MADGLTIIQTDRYTDRHLTFYSRIPDTQFLFTIKRSDVHSNSSIGSKYMVTQVLKVTLRKDAFNTNESSRVRQSAHITSAPSAPHPSRSLDN